MNGKLVAPLTGIGFVVAAIVSIVLVGGEPPEADSPVREIVDHYVDNKGTIQIGAFVGMLAVAMLIFFAGYLRKVLSTAEGENGFLSALVLVGASVMAIGLTIDGTISFALASAAEDVDPTAVQALQALWDNDFLPLALGTIVFFLSSGLSIVMHGALPKWLGWIAIAFGVLGVTPLFFVGFIGGAIWIVIVSVILMLRARGETSGTAGPATTAGAPSTTATPTI